MATLIRPKRWGIQKPSSGARINWGHSLAQGLVACLVAPEGGGAPVDIASNRLLTTITPNLAFAAAGKRGTVLRQDASGSGYWRWPGSSFLSLTSCTVVVAKRKLDTTNRASAAFGQESESADDRRIGAHLPYSDGVVYWDFGRASGANRLTYSGGTFGDDIWGFVAGTRGSSIWQNGVQRASQTTALTRVDDSGTNFCLGRGNNTAATDNNDFAFIYVWARELTPSEIQWLNVEPYAFIQPQAPARRYWTVPSTVATITATFAAPLGALTTTITATVEHPATFAAPLGGLSATATATPEHPAVLGAPLGSLSASFTATPEHSATLAAPLGGLTATITATPEHPATFDAPLGEVSASITATVEHPAILAAPLGSLAATTSATPEHPATLDAPLGSLTGMISTGPDHPAVLAAALDGLTASITAAPEHPASFDAPLGPITATVAATIEHPATFDAPLGSLMASAPFVISHQALLEAHLGGLVASVAPTVQGQAVFTALLGGLHGAIIISVPDLNPRHFTYQEPRRAVTYTESSTVTFREAANLVYQER